MRPQDPRQAPAADRAHQHLAADRTRRASAGRPCPTCSRARRTTRTSSSRSTTTAGRTLRFGDGELGPRPPPARSFTARLPHRQRHGAAMSAPDTILRIVFGQTVDAGSDLRPRNPLPALGRHRAGGRAGGQAARAARVPPRARAGGHRRRLRAAAPSGIPAVQRAAGSCLRYRQLERGPGRPSTPLGGVAADAALLREVGGAAASRSAASATTSPSSPATYVPLECR